MGHLQLQISPLGRLSLVLSLVYSSNDMTNRQNPTGGNHDTPNRDAAMEELVKSAVVNGVQSVTAGLGELQHRLESVASHMNANTVAAHGAMLKDCLDPIDSHLTAVQTQVLERIDQRVDPLNDNLNTTQNAVDGVDQRVDSVGKSVQMLHEVVRVEGEVQTRLAAENLVRTSQVSSTYPIVFASNVC